MGRCASVGSTDSRFHWNLSSEGASDAPQEIRKMIHLTGDQRDLLLVKTSAKNKGLSQTACVQLYLWL